MTTKLDEARNELGRFFTPACLGAMQAFINAKLDERRATEHRVPETGPGAPVYGDTCPRPVEMAAPAQRVDAVRSTPESEHPDKPTPIKDLKGALQRFIDGHFGNLGKERPRISIPADRNRDDDLVLMAAIDELERLRAEKETSGNGASTVGGERAASVDKDDRLSNSPSAECQKSAGPERVCEECGGAKYVCGSYRTDRGPGCQHGLECLFGRRPCQRCAPAEPAKAAEEEPEIEPNAPERLDIWIANGYYAVDWPTPCGKAYDFGPVRHYVRLDVHESALRASEARVKELSKERAEDAAAYEASIAFYKVEVAELRKFRDRVIADVGAAIARHEAWQTELAKGGA